MQKNNRLNLSNAIEALNFIFESAYILFNKPGDGDSTWRSCNRSNGKPKIGYESKEEANMESIRLFSNGEPCKPYKCQLCGKYHTGHRRCNTHLVLLGMNTARAIIDIVNINNDDDSSYDDDFDNFYCSL